MPKKPRSNLAIADGDNGFHAKIGTAFAAAARPGREFSKRSLELLERFGSKLPYQHPVLAVMRHPNERPFIALAKCHAVLIEALIAAQKAHLRANEHPTTG